MGFFDKIFGSEPQYPELAADTTAAARIEAIRQNLEELARDVSDPLEVVPGEEGAYVFIGKPPKRFGIAWIEDNRVKSFKSLMAEHGVSGEAVAKVSEELREIYQRHQNENRYHAKVANRDVVVTPSDPLEHEVREVLSRLQ